MSHEAKMIIVADAANAAEKIQTREKSERGRTSR